MPKIALIISSWGVERVKALGETSEEKRASLKLMYKLLEEIEQIDALVVNRLLDPDNVKKDTESEIDP